MIGTAARRFAAANKTGIAVAACVFMLLGLSLVGRAGGTFIGEADIVLFPPSDGGSARFAAAGDQSLIAFAGATQLAVRGGSTSDRSFSGSQAPLYGFGVRNGARATVPTEGGQWLKTFHAAVLQIDAVDTDPSAAARAVEEKAAQVQQFLDERQSDEGVLPNQRVAAIPFPAQPRITYIPAHPLKAAAAGILMLGVCLMACRLATARPLP